MLLSRLKITACVAAMAGTAVYAYEHRGAALSRVLLALVCTVLAGIAWHRVGKRKKDARRDPALSTLVIPPESKFQESASRKW